jgi:protein phosphatase
MRYVWATATHPGLIRDANEDAVLPEDDGTGDGPLTVAVADGMGGHAAGEIASSIAIETAASGEGTAAERIARANQAVWRGGVERTDRTGMGTTLTLGVFHADGTLDVGHVGDSRLYLARRGGLLQVTGDHSLVAEYLASGQITEEEAENHPRRNVITRALGIEPDIEVDEHTVHLRPGDRVLLCTDGLTTMVAPDELKTIMVENESPQAAAWALIESANKAGGEDNITVAVVDAIE